jgi:hypothetical protein
MRSLMLMICDLVCYSAATFETQNQTATVRVQVAPPKSL